MATAENIPVVAYTKCILGPAIFKFYACDKSVENLTANEKFTGKCLTCRKGITGSKKITSNFVSHLKVRKYVCLTNFFPNFILCRFTSQLL
jgi:hypothetical protein